MACSSLGTAPAAIRPLLPAVRHHTRPLGVTAPIRQSSVPSAPPGTRAGANRGAAHLVGLFRPSRTRRGQTVQSDASTTTSHRTEQYEHSEASSEGSLDGIPLISRAIVSCARIASAIVSPRGGLKSILLGNQHLGLSQAGALGLTIGWPGTSFGELFTGLSQNYVFMVGFVAWFTAQFMKIFTHRARKGKWRLKAFVDSGGMPSSHSSLCSGVTTAVGMSQGFTSPLFAVGLCFSVIVMYDAAGVRRHAGKQAEVLNMIIRDLWEGKPVSERQLLAVLRSPGATDYSLEDPKSSLEDDEDRELTLSQDRTQPWIIKSSDPEQLRKMEEERNWRMEKAKLISSTADDTIMGEKKLKEVLGHTPVQVGAGAALGVLVGLCLKPVGA